MVSNDNMNNSGSWQNHRKNEFIRRNLSHTAKYNITFFGAGGVTDRALDMIVAAAKFDQFVVPIGDITIVGRDSSESASIRKKLSSDKRIAGNGSIDNIFSKTTEELSDVLFNTQLFFFTASNHDPSESNRAILIDKNIPLIDLVAKYINNVDGGYKGLINIVSNPPEVLAHYAATVWNLHDFRQITAGVPIDLNRYADYLRDKILPLKYKNAKFQLEAAAHHDLPYVVVSGASKIEFEIDDPNNFLKRKTYVEPLSDLILQLGETSAKISKAIRSYVSQAVKDQKNSQKNTGVGPTVVETGTAICDLALAADNHTTTATAVPQVFDGIVYYVCSAVLFDPYPMLNEVIVGRRSPEDNEQIKQRICGIVTPEENTVLMSLKELLDFTSHTKGLFLPQIPSSTAALDSAFNSFEKVNPVGVSRSTLISSDPALMKDLQNLKKKQEKSDKFQEDINLKFSKIQNTIEKNNPINQEAQKEKQKDEFRTALARSLSTTVYVQTFDRLRITSHNFNNSLTPRIAGEFSIGLKDFPNQNSFKKRQDRFKEENKRIISFVDHDSSGVYILARRITGSGNNDFRLYSFSLDGRNKELSAPIVGSLMDADFNVASLCVENGLISFGAIKDGVPGIYSYNKNNNVLSLSSETLQMPTSILSPSSGLVITKNGVSEGKNNIANFEYSSEHSMYLKNNDLVFYVNENKLGIVDVQSKDVASFSSQDLRVAAHEDNSGIQVITSLDSSSFEVAEYSKKENIFSGSNGTQRFVLKDSLFKDINYIRSFNKNIFFAQSDTQAFAVYHVGNTPHVEVLNITNFKNIRG